MLIANTDIECSGVSEVVSEVEVDDVKLDTSFDNAAGETCSICAMPIKDFIQEYFWGEKINPACSKCKDYSLSECPFSSFPNSDWDHTPDIPPSLVSHWLQPSPHVTGNIGTISSLRAHYCQLPNPGDTFVSKEEVLQEFRAMLEDLRKEFQENLKQSLASMP